MPDFYSLLLLQCLNKHSSMHIMCTYTARILNHRICVFLYRYIWPIYYSLSLQSIDVLKLTAKSSSLQFSAVTSHIQLFATPGTAACQASLSITKSWSLLKVMSIELVMPSNILIFCRPVLLPPSIFHSIRVFSNESVLWIRWPTCWNFSFNISPSSEYSG